MPSPSALVDLHAIARALDVDLEHAFGQLRALYAAVDAQNARNTAELNLPCHRGCSMCCHESVFVTGLEFFYAWDHVQRTLPVAERVDIVARGLALYDTFAGEIARLEAPPPPGERDHFAIAKSIRFRCPLLADDGACRVYPAREMLARLFGCSFNDDRGIYGCYLVADHLKGRTVTLARARPQAARLHGLPLTEKRQIYPYWLHLLYGDSEARPQATPPRR